MIKVNQPTPHKDSIHVEFQADNGCLFITQEYGSDTDEIQLYEDTIVPLIKAIAQEAGLDVKIGGK